jgi:hypothetical protein
MDRISHLLPQNCHPGENRPCAERVSLLHSYVAAIEAVNRELANEYSLPPADRLNTLAAVREKERIKIELRFHERAHGCGVQPITLARLTA